MAENKSNELWSIGGARLSKSGKRVNITLMKNGENGNTIYGTSSIKLEGTKVCKVKLQDDCVLLKIKMKANETKSNEEW